MTKNQLHFQFPSRKLKISLHSWSLISRWKWVLNRRWMAWCAQSQRTEWLPPGKEVGFPTQQWGQDLSVTWENEANQCLQRLPLFLLLGAKSIYYLNSKGPWKCLVQCTYFTKEKTENQKWRHSFEQLTWEQNLSLRSLFRPFSSHPEKSVQMLRHSPQQDKSLASPSLHPISVSQVFHSPSYLCLPCHYVL